MSLGSLGEGVDLVTPWSTVECVHWKAPYSRPYVRHWRYCPDCDDVDPYPNYRVDLSMGTGLVDAPPAAIDGMCLRYPLEWEMQPPSRVRSALIAEKSHRTVEN